MFEENYDINKIALTFNNLPDVINILTYYYYHRNVCAGILNKSFIYSSGIKGSWFPGDKFVKH